MSKTLRKLISQFPTKEFVSLTEIPDERGGSVITKPTLPSEFVFELLEIIYGEYRDLNQGFLFVDDKSTWERYFRTPNGILTVYDYRGGCSIGHSGQLNEKLKSDAKMLREAIEKNWKTYLSVKPKILKERILEDPLGNFMRTFFAVSVLLKKAKHAGSDIETLVLSASHVDAMLRLGIILKTQLDQSVGGYDPTLVFQYGKIFKTERTIFQDALSIKIIGKAEFSELSKLYDFRNRAVHRYFISDFEYSELKSYLARYDSLIGRLGKKLEKLEQEQVKKGVGMTTAENIGLDEKTVRSILRDRHLKIDSSKYVNVIPKRNVLFPENEDY